MTTSSITAALPGTASSTSRGQSCPSACAIGHIGPDQRDLVLVDTKQSRPAKRRDWPEDLKRQMVAETLEAGSSVSIVARRHDVNTNQLFKWRRELLPKEPRAETEGGPMEAVDMVPDREPLPGPA